jgi:hypothetical protein
MLYTRAPHHHRADYYKEERFSADKAQLLVMTSFLTTLLQLAQLETSQKWFNLSKSE